MITMPSGLTLLLEMSVAKETKTRLKSSPYPPHSPTLLWVTQVAQLSYVHTVAVRFTSLFKCHLLQVIGEQTRRWGACQLLHCGATCPSVYEAKSSSLQPFNTPLLHEREPFAQPVAAGDCLLFVYSCQKSSPARQ